MVIILSYERSDFRVQWTAFFTLCYSMLYRNLWGTSWSLLWNYRVDNKVM